MIQQHFANPLAPELLRGEYRPQLTIHVEFSGEQFVFSARS
ncbi:MAG: hypothetical protein ACK557_03010 [Planctomycetota bacterium]